MVPICPALGDRPMSCYPMRLRKDRAKIAENLEPRRMLSAGQLDATFGQGGASAIQVEAGGSIGSITPLEDGKLLVATSFNGMLNFFRLNSDGSPDITFGAGGRLAAAFASDGKQIAVDSTGRIAVANDSSIAMFTDDGAPDSSFAAGGVLQVSATVGDYFTPAGASHLAFTDDDSLVVAAPVEPNPPPILSDEPNVALFRVGRTGTLALDFSAPDGMEMVPNERIDGLTLSGDQHIFLATHDLTTVINDAVEEPLAHVQIHRFVPDGSTDAVADIGGGLDNLSERVKAISTAADGSVVAMIYDLDQESQTYHYALRRFAAIGGEEIDNRPLAVPQSWPMAFEISGDAEGHLFVAGEDINAAWYAQRYGATGDLDPSYGALEDVYGTATTLGRPDIAGPNEFLSGDSAVLPDGSVLFANTRDRVGKPHDLVFAKLAGGEGTPADITLNAKGTLIIYGTPIADHISLYLRGRDGRLIVRADDYVRSFSPSRVKRIAIFGGDGDDVETIGPGIRGAYLEGDNGNDTLTGGDNADVLFGGPGEDSLSGGLARDKIFGDDGNDILSGNGGNDYLLGGAGSDNLYGNGNDDTLSGAGGNDRLSGGGGADILLGGDGSDSAPDDPLDSRDSIEILL